MADFVFNIAKGKVGYYVTLPAASDSIILVPLELTGIETDAVLKDKDTLADVLSGTTNEQTTMGRKTLAGVTGTVNDTNDRFEADATDPVYVGPTGNDVTAVVICYKPDAASADSAIIPLVKLDCTIDPVGGDITLVFDVGGWFQAA